MPVEGRGLGSRQTQQAAWGREIGQPNNSETCSKAADGVTRESEGRSWLSLLCLVACRLDAPTAFAYMDPPTPWLTWAMALWNSSLNQNLLHPATAPVARHIEEKVIAWLAPFFGMQGGHMTPGATTANLTALWSARECAGVEEVVTSDNAHLSIAKAAHLLGLRYRSLPSSPLGALLPEG